MVLNDKRIELCLNIYASANQNNIKFINQLKDTPRQVAYAINHYKNITIKQNGIKYSVVFGENKFSNTLDNVKISVTTGKITKSIKLFYGYLHNEILQEDGMKTVVFYSEEIQKNIFSAPKTHIFQYFSIKKQATLYSIVSGFGISCSNINFSSALKNEQKEILFALGSRKQYLDLDKQIVSNQKGFER